jgi:hypothetical protein
MNSVGGTQEHRPLAPARAGGRPDRPSRASGGRSFDLLVALSAHVAIRVLGVAVLVTVGLAHKIPAHDRLVGWDSGWYRGIAAHGYGFTRVLPDGRSLSDYAFFPLFPALERLLSDITGLRLLDAGLVISAISSCVAAWGIFAVGRHVCDARTGVVVVVLWSALPIGIVESMAYTESLFTALAAWALYSTLRDRFILAGLLATLAGLTRPFGGAVVLAVVLAALLRVLARRAERTDAAELPRPAVAPVVPVVPVVLGALIAPLGLAGYLGWVSTRRGNILGYFDVTNGWGNGFDGGLAFLRWIGDMFAGPRAVLGVLVCVGVALLVWLLGAAVRQRYPVSLVVYAAASVFIALTTSSYFGSKPRYLLPAFPLLLPVAAYIARTGTKRLATGLASFAVAGSVYGAFWLYGAGPP